MDGLFLLERWMWPAIIAAVMSVAAIASILLSRHSTKAKVIWIAVVLLLPFFGAVAWFALAREAARHRKPQ